MNEIPLSRRHFMPAGSIGYFSSDQEGPRRDRRIFCRRKNGAVAYQTKPDKVAWSRTVYGAGKDALNDHDDYFSPFEQLNDDAVTDLLEDRCRWKDANIWVRLAGYVASRLTRTPDTEFELAETMSDWGSPHVTVGYPMDMQRMSASVLRTRWELVSIKDYELILNDRGFAGFFHSEWDAAALVVPLRPHYAVVIGGGQRHQKQLRWSDEKWQIELPTHYLARSLVEDLNTLLWFGARDECYASDGQLLDDAVSDESPGPEVRDLADARPYVLGILGSSLEERMADELLLLRLLPGIDPGGAETPFLWV